jgi:hypothetical protein
VGCVCVCGVTSKVVGLLGGVKVKVKAKPHHDGLDTVVTKYGNGDAEQ